MYLVIFHCSKVTHVKQYLTGVQITCCSFNIYLQFLNDGNDDQREFIMIWQPLFLYLLKWLMAKSTSCYSYKPPHTDRYKLITFTCVKTERQKKTPEVTTLHLQNKIQGGLFTQCWHARIQSWILLFFLSLISAAFASVIMRAWIWKLGPEVWFLGRFASTGPERAAGKIVKGPILTVYLL